MNTFLITFALFLGFGGVKKSQHKTRPIPKKEIVEIDEADQKACEEEARLMAKLKSRSHLGCVIGKFEGIGVSKNPHPLTCCPESDRQMKCTGDAVVERDGWFYRVRSFR